MRRLFLVLLSLLLLSAGCSGGPGESFGTSHSGITPRYGVDYSYARPSPSSIRAAGYTFAARYLSYTPAKDLSKGEADALIAAGIDIVSNWEASSDAALNGYSQGASDAAQAQSEAVACGMPSTRPIYFSVDFDAAPDQQAAINDYFDGVASVLGRSRTGAYGGFYVIQRLFDAGKITWGWQTYAWSGGQWDPRAQMRQILNGIDGGQEDEDEAVATDFGQWGTAPAPPPPPPPSPARGSLDAVTCDSISGWAQDPNTAKTAISVDLYLDGPLGQGIPLGRFPAGDDRSDLCSAIGSCNHAFDVRPPTSLYDGNAHSVYGYAIAVTSGAPNAELQGSPKTLHCAAALTGDFEGTGYADVVQFRDDWGSIPMCGRWGSDWSCTNRPATYVGGLGAGHGGAGIWSGATPLVGDVNGDGKDDVIEFAGAWQSIPVCFSTGKAWACENLHADYVGGLGAGNAGSGIYDGATPLVGDVNGDGRADIIEYNPAWGSFPVCLATDGGWSCSNLEAHYVGGLGAGNGGTGVYGTKFGSGTVVLAGDVNGDGRADIIQYNSAWGSIPVCFSTDRGFSCENLEASYVGGLGAGNAGTGVYRSTTVTRLGDFNGDGRVDVLQFDSGWASLPVCFSTGRGWSCENIEATYVGGMGAGNGGSGIYGASDVLVSDVNGDGLSDVIQYKDDWQSIPVCFGTNKGFSCENGKAAFGIAPAAAGNSGSAVYAYGVPLAARFEGGKSGGVVQIDPDSGWKSLPLCSLASSGWSCSSSLATVY